MESQTGSNNDADQSKSLVDAVPPDPVAKSKNQDTEWEQSDEAENHDDGMHHGRNVLLPDDCHFSKSVKHTFKLYEDLDLEICLKDLHVAELLLGEVLVRNAAQRALQGELT